MMVRVEGIRYRKPVWVVYRFWQNADGIDDDAKDLGLFWDQTGAVEEADRLNRSNTDPAVRYEVLEHEVIGVYPADEKPPWVSDPDRWKKRGYEAPRLG
jgi:hypothetical protein